MSMPEGIAMQPPTHLDEAQFGPCSSELFTRVAADHRPVIVQRDGVDVAAVVPLEFLDLVQDELARQQAERLAEQIAWNPQPSAGMQQWLEGDEPKPF
jgi:hypothetical protein